MQNHMEWHIHKKMNNILDLSDERNQLFIASVLAVLCETYPVKVSLKDIEKYWSGDIQRLQYELIPDINSGSITFSLKDKK